MVNKPLLRETIGDVESLEFPGWKSIGWSILTKGEIGICWYFEEL